MKAIILAGGLGTRLREETIVKPKPMVEIGGKPILWHIMKNLSHFGINEFIIAAGYKSEIIKDYFIHFQSRNSDFTVKTSIAGNLSFHNNGLEDDWTVTIADTGINTLTGGRILQTAKYLDDEPFLVTYGDGLTDLDISKLSLFHLESGLIATVTTVQPKSRFGVIKMNQAGLVEKFSENPKLDGWINAGFFIFRKEIMDYLVFDEALEDSPLTRLVADRQLGAFKHDGFWQPMDTYRESLYLEKMWEDGNAPWKNW